MKNIIYKYISMRAMTFFILCISFFSWSCNPCTSTDTIEIPTEVRDYFGVFKPGNYWVYQTNSLKYDSMYVSYYKDSTVSYGYGNATCDRLKTLSIKIKSNFLNLSSSSSLYTLISRGNFFYTLSLDTDRSVSLNYYDRKLASPKELKDTITSLYKNLYLKKNVGIVAYKIDNDSFYLVRKKIM